MLPVFSDLLSLVWLVKPVQCRFVSVEILAATEIPDLKRETIPRVRVRVTTRMTPA